MLEPIPTPLHDKLEALMPKRDAAQELLDWLTANGYVIASWLDYYDDDEGSQERLVPTADTKETIIGKYLGISPRGLAHEKDALYARLVESNVTVSLMETVREFLQ